MYSIAFFLAIVCHSYIYTLAANLDIPASETTGTNNCSGASPGQVFRNTCFVDQSYGYKLLGFRAGDFCPSYKLTCNAASGNVVCALFNNITEAYSFTNTPAQAPVRSLGNCTGELTCSFSGTYPNPAGNTIPHIGLYKTQYATDRVLNFTVGTLTEYTHPTISIADFS